jgi:hypothetical protein
MRRSLTDGLAVVVRRIGHCGHRTSLPQDFHIWGYIKYMIYERKLSRREEIYHRIFDVARRMNDPDVVRKVQIILNLKYP